MVARKLLALMLVTGGLAMMMVPTASAQQPVTAELSCQDGPDEVQPLGTPGTWSCTATVTWAGGTTPNQISPVGVTINPSGQASWMNVVVSPSSFTVFPPNDGPGERVEPFEVSVSLTADAPAFIQSRLALEPQLETGQDQDPRESGTEIAVTPGYFNLYNVRLDEKIQEGGPDSGVLFPIQVSNFSNGDTRFDFRLAQEEAPAGHQAVIPDQLVLRSVTSGEETRGTANFQVFTPFKNGYVNRIASIQLLVESSYAPDTSIQGATSQVSTLTKTKGFYVPGPGAVLTTIGMLGVALALTQGRDNRWD